MDITAIWGTANNVASYILGNKRERRTVIISSGEERFALPVTPFKYTVQTAQDNKIFDILDTGEALIFGTPKLKKLKFGCFFPATKHRYPFVVGDIKENDECIALLEKWKENKNPVRVIITDSPINLKMAIIEMNYREQDGTRDIYFDLTLNEYRDLNTPQANNTKTIDALSGLKDRPTADRALNEIAKFVEGAQDLLEKSKAAYGVWTQLPTLQNVNNIKTLALRNVSSVIKGGGWKW